MEKFKRQISKITDELREQISWGGDEDSEGNLQPGHVDVEELESKIGKAIRKLEKRLNKK